ncbi:gamma-glutamyltransferase [Actinoplanes sp. LDG1-06]|uniref:Gamma-glutamyltransferase n=1 Tax=Paractinoplanes ovalisporus TaxID=2810368 RepID=A0ABS2AQA2_9ACTN|nr:gamma-glutamyltransferase [Actinoplanes ovalisporus]MBM2621999.1 gamma-glutamyltransferase [Actinoplanes ovalisporus]
MSVAVAAPHPAAVEAARTVVAAGGNAFDAALAAAGALTVAYPHQCSVGGDLVAMVRPAGSPVRAVLSIGAAALAVDVAALGSRMPLSGPQTVTVPGVVAGWTAVHALGARLPMAELLAPSVRLATEGVDFAPGLRAAIQGRLDDIRADPGLAAVMLQPRLVQPALADTLDEIGRDWRSFYSGPLGRRLVTGLRALGSPLAEEDFAAHVAEVGAPLRKVVGAATWHAAPPPVQGATFLALVGSPSSSLLADSRRAQAARDALLGDPRSGPVDVEGMLRPHSFLSSLSASRKPTGDTVAVTAVDESGNAVTLIQSVFESFGAGLLEPSTGVVLHNRGSSFRLDPSHPGRIAPGVRPPHTLCPTIATTAEGVIALGCQGGRSQPWILAQVASGVLTAPDPAEQVARPRWILRGDELLAEPGAPVPPSGATFFDGPHDDAGHVQLSRLLAGKLDAGSDPRADGLAAVLV